MLVGVKVDNHGEAMREEPLHRRNEYPIELVALAGP